MKITYQGRQVEGEEVEVLTETERWNEYQLADGSVLSVKLVLIKVVRAIGEKAQDGSDLYMINSQNVVKVKPAPGKDMV